VLAIVIIEITLVVTAYVQKQYYGKIIQAENTGKIKMILQSLGIGALLIYVIWNIAIFLTLAQYFFYGAIIFALLSLVVYRAI
jgi:phosphatidylglycerophosphate synthase